MRRGQALGQWIETEAATLADLRRRMQKKNSAEHAHYHARFIHFAANVAGIHDITTTPIDDLLDELDDALLRPQLRSKVDAFRPVLAMAKSEWAAYKSTVAIQWNVPLSALNRLQHHFTRDFFRNMTLSKLGTNAIVTMSAERYERLTGRPRTIDADFLKLFRVIYDAPQSPALYGPMRTKRTTHRRPDRVEQKQNSVGGRVSVLLQERRIGARHAAHSSISMHIDAVAARDGKSAQSEIQNALGIIQSNQVDYCGATNVETIKLALHDSVANWMDGMRKKCNEDSPARIALAASKAIKRATEQKDEAARALVPSSTDTRDIQQFCRWNAAKCDHVRAIAVRNVLVRLVDDMKKHAKVAGSVHAQSDAAVREWELGIKNCGFILGKIKNRIAADEAVIKATDKSEFVSAYYRNAMLVDMAALTIPILADVKTIAANASDKWRKEVHALFDAQASSKQIDAISVSFHRMCASSVKLAEKRKGRYVDALKSLAACVDSIMTHNNSWRHVPSISSARNGLSAEKRIAAEHFFLAELPGRVSMSAHDKFRQMLSTAIKAYEQQRHIRAKQYIHVDPTCDRIRLAMQQSGPQPIAWYVERLDDVHRIDVATEMLEKYSGRNSNPTDARRLALLSNINL